MGGHGLSWNDVSTYLGIWETGLDKPMQGTQNHPISCPKRNVSESVRFWWPANSNLSNQTVQWSSLTELMADTDSRSLLALGHSVCSTGLSQSLYWLKFAATVYKAINIINRHIYTIKLEPVSHGKSSSLKQESHILKQLHKGTAVSIPRIHWFGRESNFDVLVLDLLGPSLQHLVALWGKFNVVTVQHVGDQLVSVMYVLIVLSFEQFFSYLW